MEIQSRALGLYTTLASILFANMIIIGVEYGIFSYPSIFVSSLLMTSAYLLIIRYLGVISPTSIFCMFIIYPSIVPFLANYIFSVQNYTLRAVPYQNEDLIKMGSFLVAIFMWIVAGISISRVQGRDYNMKFGVDLYELTSKYRHPFSKYSFIMVSVIVILSAYLTTPGPTILTVDYSTVIQNYFPWASFAGNLYIGSWVVLLLSSQNTNGKTNRYFYLITILTILWLFLHARRNESLGVLLAFSLFYGHQFKISEIFSSLRKIVYTCATLTTGLLFVIVGEVRSGGTNFNIGSLFLSNRLPGGSIKLPGGGHNFFATYQFTTHHYYNNYLWGSTFWHYPVQLIPGPILSISQLRLPPYYFDLMAKNYRLYNGGNFFLNEYFANFGPYGILFCAVAFGVLLSGIERSVSKDSIGLSTGLAMAFIAAVPRSMWYWQGNWINAILAYLITYSAYVLVLNTSRIISRIETSIIGLKRQ